MTHVEKVNAVLSEMALALSNSLSNAERFDGLLSNIRKVVSCDAVALLAFQGNELKPLSVQGLSVETLGRRFLIQDHPRFVEICAATVPIKFASDSALPDPYDGLLMSERGNLPVHACMGVSLMSDGILIGVLTLDSLTPGSFDALDDQAIISLGAMAAATLKTALRYEALEQQAFHDRQMLSEISQQSLKKEGVEIIGESKVMHRLKSEISLVASSDLTALIVGETGTGKELVAATIHAQSKRSHRPLIYVNCAALAENLIESELFGHVKGAFTGADKDREGKFQLAKGGTIFLDEIGEISLSVQSKLLRVLQSGEVQPVGKDLTHHVDVRVVAATNRNLKQEVEDGKFRADLYHRLSVYPIDVPPLNRRENDVVLLAGFFMERAKWQLGIKNLRLPPESESALLEYSWPGNVRELEHLIGRAALRASVKSNNRYAIELSPDYFDLSADEAFKAVEGKTSTEPDQAIAVGVGLKEATIQYQRQMIERILVKEQCNWSAAARSLKTDRANLVRLAKRLGIEVQKQLK